MDEHELKYAYYELLQAELDNFHGIPLESTPFPIRLAVAKLVKYSGRDATVQSERIADLSQTFADIKGFPSDVLALIRPYRRRKVKFI